jgi:hypothetical protein
MVLYGSTHATRAHDFIITSNNSSVINYDYSANLLYLYPTAGTASVIASDAGLAVGSTGNTYTINQRNTDQALYLTGSTTVSTGANIQLFGSTHATSAGDFLMRNGTGSVIAYNDSAGTLTLDNAEVVVTKSVKAVHPTNKNMVIGGDFTTNPWQRGTSFAAVALNAYSADRWVWSGFGSTAVVTISQVEDAPTTSSSRHCLQIDVTTADTSIAASDILVLQHRIEGKNIAHLHAGTANAKTVTVSFWHKHTKTGVYCVGFRSGGAGYSYTSEYTQSVTETWEKAEITLTLETAGGTSEWPLDNTEGLRLSFVMAAGSDYHIPADTWSVGSDFSTSNQVNAADSNSNFMRIADVQLELGEAATTFESRDAGTELALCQRYFCKSYDQGADPGSAAEAGSEKILITTGTGVRRTMSTTARFPVSMRAAATVTPYAPVSGTSGVAYDVQAAADVSAPLTNGGADAFSWQAIQNNTTTTYHVVMHWTADAEL